MIKPFLKLPELVPSQRFYDLQLNVRDEAGNDITSLEDLGFRVSGFRV